MRADHHRKGTISHFVRRKNNLAAVRFEDYRTGIVDKEGKIRMKTDRYKRMKFLPDDIVAVTDRNDKTSYIDLRCNRHYMDKPVVMKFGQIEILKQDASSTAVRSVSM